MGDVTTILQIHSDSERLTDLPTVTQLENGEIGFEFQFWVAPRVCTLISQ